MTTSKNYHNKVSSNTLPIIIPSPSDTLWNRPAHPNNQLSCPIILFVRGQQIQIIQCICKKMLFSIFLFARGWSIRVIQCICKKMFSLLIILFARGWPIRMIQSICKENIVSDYPLCKRLTHPDDPKHLQKNVVSNNPLCRRLAHPDDPKHLQKNVVSNYLLWKMLAHPDIPKHWQKRWRFRLSSL